VRGRRCPDLLRLSGTYWQSFDSAMSTKWRELVDNKRKRQAETIPNEWLIQLPSESTKDITSIPESCGLLSDIEIIITRTDVDDLLQSLAQMKWTSVEVTRAFYKRAIIAHQLVKTSIIILPLSKIDLHIRRTV
jgi:hypothetical protein